MEGNMNYYYENADPDFDTQQQPSSPKQSNSMATAALVFGICSLVFICCGGSFVFGALGIIFALLSRGAANMNNNAKAGLILSIIGFVITIVVYTVSIVALISSGEITDLIENYMYYYEYGDEFDYYELDEDYFDDLLEQYGEGGDL